MEFVHWSEDADSGRYAKLLHILLDDTYIYYDKLSPLAVLAYTLLCDRRSLSLSKGWKDDAGHVYCVYPRGKMAKKLKVSPRKVDGIYNELKEAGLLISVKVGYSKPNHLYVGVPVLPPSDAISSLNSAESARLIAQDLLPSYTDFSHLEKKYNEKYTLSNDSGYFSSTLKDYNEWYALKNKKPHPRIKQDQYERIMDALTATNINPEALKDYVEYHFHKLPKNNDGNINSFIYALPRYIKDYEGDNW